MKSPLAEAFAALSAPEEDVRSRRFPVASRCLVQRAKDRQKKRDAAAVRGIINPENADAILDAFPIERGDRLHAITSGDFIYSDLLLRLIARHGKPESATITTLSMSVKNVEAIAAMLKHDPFPLHLVLSHYFKNTNGEIFRAIEELLIAPGFPGFRITIGRSHAKVALFEYQEKCFVIEGSANLRSSSNIEQIFAVQDREVFDFHRAWIEELAVAEKIASEG